MCWVQVLDLQPKLFRWISRWQVAQGRGGATADLIPHLYARFPKAWGVGGAPGVAPRALVGIAVWALSWLQATLV